MQKNARMGRPFDKNACPTLYFSLCFCVWIARFLRAKERFALLKEQIVLIALLRQERQERIALVPFFKRVTRAIHSFALCSLALFVKEKKERILSSLFKQRATRAIRFRRSFYKSDKSKRVKEWRAKERILNPTTDPHCNERARFTVLNYNLIHITI